MPVSKMNGQPLVWRSYTDFGAVQRSRAIGTPGRRTVVGRYISQQTAERAVRTMRRNPIFGQPWIENLLGDRFEVA